MQARQAQMEQMERLEPQERQELQELQVNLLPAHCRKGCLFYLSLLARWCSLALGC